MFYTILDDLILYQLLSFCKKYSNHELQLHSYFFSKTQIDPSYIISIRIDDTEYIFFFVEKESYPKARTYLNALRKDFRRKDYRSDQNNKKITIIKTDNVLIHLIFNLFPDLQIHDIKIEINHYLGMYEILVLLLKDLNLYHIAVGRNGGYIKAVNVLFENYIKLDNKNTPVKIKCKAVS